MELERVFVLEILEKRGVSIFLGEEVVLWIKEMDMPKPSAKYGTLISVDHSHVVIEFTQGSLKGKIQAYRRTDIKRIALAKNVRGDRN